jgi:hypothetical protein
MNRRLSGISFSFHSHLKTKIGSTFVERCAGIQHANNATPESNKVTVINVNGSVALTSYRKLLTQRVTANAPANPTITPAQISHVPCLSIKKRSPFETVRTQSCGLESLASI